MEAADPILPALIDGSECSTWSNTRILGVRLRKFSLWHRLLLRAVGSPFINQGDMTLHDLRTAVGICRLPYGNSRIRKPGATWFQLKMVGSALFRKKNPATALEGLAKAFVDYCGDYVQDPEYGVHRKGGGEPQTPRGRFQEEFEHASDLILMGLPESRAWNMPIGLASFYRVIYHRSLGADIDAVTEEERKFTESLPDAYRHF